MLLHYQWLLCRGGVVATIALQAAPTVKAYMKTIGQPTQNVRCCIATNRAETTIGEGALGRLSGDGKQWKPSKVSISR